MHESADGWIRLATIASVLFLAAVLAYYGYKDEHEDD